MNSLLFPTWSRFFTLLLLLVPGLSALAQVSSTNVVTGTISVPGERDQFVFSISNRTSFYFDALSNVSQLNWSCARLATTSRWKWEPARVPA